MTMAKQMHDWAEMYPADLPSADRWILVADEMTTFGARLADGETARQALDDYAAGYDAGDEPCRCKVTWVLWQGGEMVDEGTYWWDCHPRR